MTSILNRREGDGSNYSSSVGWRRLLRIYGGRCGLTVKIRGLFVKTLIIVTKLACLSAVSRKVASSSLG